MLNHVKGFAQRLQQQQGKQNGQGGDPEAAAKAQLTMMQGALKLKNTAESHASRTAQKQASFELAEQRADRKNQADIRRENEKARQELVATNAKTVQDIHTNRLKSLMQPAAKPKTDA